ncbi:choice-of-anchor J domain-containing protein [Parabacteroides chongii]|uniref:choice-of-anchor J domain-containing protein n=1 Tax=Parabacteroides chongii TaxID=2685834 RepID=UPI00240E02BB|nr:choice-of-anchor J domain-containing protein [Parabacteroides chongii]WFE86762.1 choice-of-anchor J domain-containing protein [Parabacteroides chongii]
MMKKYINLMGGICFLVILFLFSSCEKEDRTYQGPLFYEFSPSECGQSVLSNIFVKEAGKNGEDRLCVQLIKPADGAVRVNFRLADQLFYIKSTTEYLTELPDGYTSDQYIVYTGTTTYGKDFEFGTGSNIEYDAKYQTGTITIPAGEMFGYIPLNILQRKGGSAYIILEDSEDARANRPTSILNLKLTAEKTFYFEESLTKELPSTWSLLDKDGDGLGWYYYAKWGLVISDSYDYDTESALSPENYLITPAIVIPADATAPELMFDLAASATNAYQEKYKIIASESPLTLDNCRDADVLRDYTELTSAYSKQTFQTEHIDLSKYVGKTIYIGFVHGDCVDMESLILKNVVVYGY